MRRWHVVLLLLALLGAASTGGAICALGALRKLLRQLNSTDPLRSLAVVVSSEPDVTLGGDSDATGRCAVKVLLTRLQTIHQRLTRAQSMLNTCNIPLPASSWRDCCSCSTIFVSQALHASTKCSACQRCLSLRCIRHECKIVDNSPC